MRNVPRIDLPPAGGRPVPAASRLLVEGWAAGKAREAIAYDPDAAETFTAGDHRYYYLPGRESRPRNFSNGEGGGLRVPHAPCPFDTGDFLEEREVARARAGDREYHIAINKFPVLPLHFLAVRPASDPPATLPQRLGGAREIGEMAALAAVLGHPWRLFFNANAGADGSRSGSSVNHWHFQLFPDAWTVAARPPRISGARDGVESGEVPGWPARHRLYRSADAAALGRAIWQDLEAVDRRDISYNLELSPREDATLIALLFPRVRLPDLELPWGDRLRGDFGGFEMSGSVVVPSPKAFEWLRAHGEQAGLLMEERLRGGTSVEPLR